ncbi:hypothetical protein RBH88_03230 [Aminobacterium sp. MB27-C1]|uniref:hypothetical protein n=1 Tax=Aminobacterium sp. MB27-C1 TaxID=3070661 RepID=UPI0027DD70F4|nr:hypothetical protein [Aminobacterium sp. MB27-C1]WMI72126.1 hypothetical protein RBH88_03230 [Aminobacterium sp. MB27-C1]
MNGLVDSICAFLKTVVCDYSLETKEKTARAPQVVAGGFSIDPTNIPQLPYVIVRGSEGKDTEGRATAVVKILVGTYTEDSAGFRDVLNIIERIRIAFGKQRVLNGRYRIEYPFSWRMIDEQPYPEWKGEITTTWEVPLPRETLSIKEEATIYGEGF